jgi:aspartyl protease family protein
MENPTAQTGQRLGVVMTVIAWIGVLLLLTWAANRFLLDDNRALQLDSDIRSDGSVQIMLQANRQGHFIAPGIINGQPVRFLVDTGATTVAIDQALADRLGVKRGWPQQIQTASGQIRGYSAVLDSVTLGDIQLRRVSAVIIPDLGLDSLLGMSFLKELTLIKRDGQLLLIQE